MGKIALTTIGTIFSSGKTVDSTGKTLIISAHGRLVGGSFTKAYQTAVQFTAPKYGALMAALTDAISGKITASENASSGPKELEHAFAYYENDPTPVKIEEAVGKAKGVDVLTINPKVTSTRAQNAPKLSDIISALKKNGYTYPSLLILACRVEKEVATGVVLKSFNVTGTKHEPVALQNQKMKDAISIAQELQKKKGFK